MDDPPVLTPVISGISTVIDVLDVSTLKGGEGGCKGAT